jgi:DNA ligase-associated metallophosphoesterase
MSAPLSLKRSACQRRIETDFAGEPVVLDAGGALYLPKRNVLVISDLHLEKGSFFASRGNPIPCYDTTDTLLRLSEVIREYRPTRVVSLGDSFHDLRAGERMLQSDSALLETLVGSVESWTWITGNHDPEIPARFVGHTVAVLNVGALYLAHRPEDAALPVVAGHYHPKHALRTSGRSIAARCFVLGAEVLLMPAFGAYAGGLRSRNRAIAALFANGLRRHVLLYGDKLWAVD